MVRLRVLTTATGRHGLLQFGVGTGIVCLATVFTLVGTAAPTGVKTSRRVVAEPSFLKPLRTEVKPVSYVQPSAASHECPQMTNPGGLRWDKSSNPGPHAVNGTVSIPRQGVNAPIVKVGVNMQGEMVVPHNARDVGWLDQGPYPGDTNNVVLAGHIAYARRAGSFGQIQQLRPGDIVVVEMDGVRYEYAVKWTCLFGRETELASQIMGRTDVPSLTMISCAGVFDPRAGTRNKRVAVRAELVRSA